MTVEGRHAQDFDDHLMSKTDDSDRIVSSENFQVRLTCDAFYMVCTLCNGVHGPLILLFAQEYVRLTVKKYPSTLASPGPVFIDTLRMYLETNVADVMAHILPAFEAVVRRPVSLSPAA